MKIAITGGTGFVGRHLARRLTREGHDVVLIARGFDRRDERVRVLERTSFATADLSYADTLTSALAGCDAVAHCAGINREIGSQTYQRVHIQGTSNVLEAARRAGVRRVLMLSFLRARPNCGSPYHESKWAAEELVRKSGLEYTILKAGMIYGRGDHMLDHLSHSLFTLPLLATVGFREQAVRPLAVDDVVDVMVAALIDGRLAGKTVSVLGPETLTLGDAVRRVAQVLGRRVLIFPAPVTFHYAMAWVLEGIMRIPLVAIAQVRILSEGVTEASPYADSLPADLQPTRRFTLDQIRRGLPEAGAFGLRDLRCCLSR
jgi:nucleoside-diphosphate-sugar epimerase